LVVPILVIAINIPQLGTAPCSSLLPLVAEGIYASAVIVKDIVTTAPGSTANAAGGTPPAAMGWRTAPVPLHPGAGGTGNATLVRVEAHIPSLLNALAVAL